MAVVNRLDVEFNSEGETCKGWLYTGEGGGRRPAVVLAGGWCYTKEIVMPFYAEAFAKAGYTALIFDYRNLGASGGAKRQHLDPWWQVRDYQNAISFLETCGSVEPSRIGAWGISYSGGHVLILAATDPRVKSIVSQIPVIDGFENMRRFHGTNEYRRLWGLILEDRKRRYEGKEPLYLPHATKNYIEDIPAWPAAEAQGIFQTIKEKQAPLYQNKSTVESVDLLLNYDVSPFVKRLVNTPTLMVVAEGDDYTLWDLEIGAFNAIPSPRKRLEVLPKTSHMTLYSDQEKIDKAVALAKGWFQDTL
jgi:pimeloyl-ACP methyl ester carboxylesterase